MYCRIGSAYRKQPADKNKAAFRAIVKRGPPPGLLAFDGDRAVGWCQVTPRDELPALDRSWRLKRVDDVPVWALSCFYVRIGYRRKGVTKALISAALKVAKRSKAPALEAYPFDAAVSPSTSSTGYAATFARAGFKVVARRDPPRPIMVVVASDTFNRRNQGVGTDESIDTWLEVASAARAAGIRAQVTISAA